MKRISDVLELLTTQHEEIGRLVEVLAETPDLEDRSRILDGLATKLTTHLAVEQELVYPEASGLVPDDVIAEVMAEHAEIKRILADLLWLEPEGPHFEHRIANLRELLAGHSAWQEDALFVELAESLSPIKLARIGETIHAWSNPPLLAVQAA